MVMLEKLKKDIDRELAYFLPYANKKHGLDRASGLLYAGIKDFLRRKGKKIRPLLFLISYLGYTKRKSFSRKKLLRSALSLELMHDFFLAHDDVIDDSAIRRGKPTLHKVFNKKLGLPGKSKTGPDLSIVAGDAMFALAIDALLSSDETPARKEEALKLLAEAAVSTAAGEFLDVTSGMESVDRISRKSIFLTYTLKTAKYTFECPLVMGAVLAGADRKEIKKLSKLGILLGQAFQIYDDLLDVFSTSKKIGKPVLSDLDESKKTLLVWSAYSKLDKSGRKTLKNLMEKKKKTYTDLTKFRKLVITTGALDHCLDTISGLLDKTDPLLRSLKMKKGHKKALKVLSQKLFSGMDT